MINIIVIAIIIRSVVKVMVLRMIIIITIINLSLMMIMKLMIIGTIMITIGTRLSLIIRKILLLQIIIIKYNKNNIGLYRDDSLATFKNIGDIR